MEVSGRYSNPPLQPVDLGQLLVGVAQIPATSAETLPPRQKQRRLRLDDLEQLRAAYLAGAAVADLAGRFGITRQTVLKHARRMGLPRRHPKLSPREAAQAVDLYSDGYSLAKVGAALGVDPTTVWRALDRAGVSARDAHGRAH